ncbi:hypothetical protein [Streptomyces guryensis]|uniref:Secreted protein n=1 Tax=Streptomyces guryensis TaxID=2886947 RepID=A0A9Q3VKE7_9ACTN|nr:hypothetical protein [Streptomyces guryensis]MCD9872933.1 hypothetical protein [Streptomyces guryensis]
MRNTRTSLTRRTALVTATVTAARAPAPSSSHQRAGTAARGCSRISAWPPQVSPASFTPSSCTATATTRAV